METQLNFQKLLNISGVILDSSSSFGENTPIGFAQKFAKQSAFSIAVVLNPLAADW